MPLCLRIMRPKMSEMSDLCYPTSTFGAFRADNKLGGGARSTASPFPRRLLKMTPRPTRNFLLQQHQQYHNDKRPSPLLHSLTFLLIHIKHIKHNHVGNTRRNQWFRPYWQNRLPQCVCAPPCFFPCPTGSRAQADKLFTASSTAM